MQKLRVLIVDDEPLARMRLRSLLAECQQPAVQVAGEAGSAAEALHALGRLSVDAVLLDIAMPGLDGLELAQRLRSAASTSNAESEAGAAAPPAVVFVTAHPDHALRAFEIDAVDYLTKPVRRARLQDALARVAQRRAPLAKAWAAAGAPAALAAAETHARGVATEAPVLVVSDRGRVLRVPVHEVLYLRAEQKYVTLRTLRHAYVLDDSLADLEQRLGAAVVRIHRNTLVAKAAVRALERRALPAGADDEPAAAATVTKSADTGESWAVQLAPGGEWMPVSRRQIAAVKAALAR